jgi:hypothetical protein
MDEFETSNAGDIRSTIYTCRKCHYQGKPMEIDGDQPINIDVAAWHFNPFVRRSQSVANNSDLASDKSSDSSSKSDKTRSNAKRYRTNPIEELDPRDPENVRSVESMSNPFIKNIKKASKNIFLKYSQATKGINFESVAEHIEKYFLYKFSKAIDIDKLKTIIHQAYRDGGVHTDMELADEVMRRIEGKISLPESDGELEFTDTKQAKTNPFVKESRQFKKTKEQEDRDQYVDFVDPTNITDPLDPKRYTNYTHSRGFDPADRQEYRNSPDPKLLIPGYKEWHENNVDEYYDGWVEDHIENSGGKIVGSNTEKTMNLNEGERNHPPVYPTEAPMERMLESRHEFDSDYIRMVASNGSNYKMASTQLLNIVSRFIEKNAGMFDFLNKNKSGKIDPNQLNEMVQNIVQLLKEGDTQAESIVQLALSLYLKEHPEDGDISRLEKPADGIDMRSRDNDKTASKKDLDEASEDKLKTTEQRLDDTEYNEVERIHQSLDEDNTKPRKNVHQSSDSEIKESCNCFINKKDNGKKKILAGKKFWFLSAPIKSIKENK